MPFEAVATETLLAGRSDWIDREAAATLADRPLEAVDTEFPHHVGAVDSPDGPERPRERHPVFYGCFDWHSAVHCHWALVRGLRLVDDHPDADAIGRSLDARLTPANVRREVDRFEADPSFERPYGWGWFLRLAAELARWDDDRADAWRSTLAPLERTIRARVADDFLARSRPLRVGTHHNSAFALGCVLDYARTVGRDDLAAAAAETARDCFADDRDYPIEYEPLGWDFLSPALIEADLLRRVSDPPRFHAWFDRFLPDFDGTDLDPVDAGADGGVALHLVGLNLSRAWCLAGLADALDGRRAATLSRCAERHAERGLARAFTDDYAGAHWLPSFALYLLTRNEGGIG